MDWEEDARAPLELNTESQENKPKNGSKENTTEPSTIDLKTYLNLLMSIENDFNNKILYRWQLQNVWSELFQKLVFSMVFLKPLVWKYLQYFVKKFEYLWDEL